MRTLLPNKAYVVKWQFFGNDDCLQVFVLPAKVEPLIVVSPLRGRMYIYTIALLQTVNSTRYFRHHVLCL